MTEYRINRLYYRLQREFSGKVITECLRFTDWKLRPAARLLGISPVKLRQDFRAYLEDLAARVSPNQPSELADALGMPLETLEKKLDDLGLELTKPEPRHGAAS
ncbi:MAG: hypothetical protein F6K19_20155 [Cyanothece sp. SIO1E1]|nr:hypothetical protein [Cyanothece sp. SIO1E1]